MANVRVQVLAPATSTPTGKAILVAAPVRVVLPWWPEDITWGSLAQTWSEQQRPGRAPLLLKEGQTNPEINLGFVASNKDTMTVGDGGSVQQLLANLQLMALRDVPVQLLLSARDTGRWRVTDLSVTELDHAVNGEPTKADVSMVLKFAQDAAAPIGPVPARKKKRK